MEIVIKQFKCKKCGEPKLRGAYRTYSSTGKRVSTCLDCERLRQAATREQVGSHNANRRGREWLSNESYAAILLFQERKCGICGLTQEETPQPERRLALDHEHEGDKRIRGLLCLSCNTKLGWLEGKWKEIGWYLGNTEFIQELIAATKKSEW